MDEDGRAFNDKAQQRPGIGLKSQQNPLPGILVRCTPSIRQKCLLIKITWRV